MARYDFDLIRGSSRSLDLFAVDQSGDAIDLTGLTGSAITWRMGDRKYDATKLTLDLDDGVSILDATTGKYQITLDPADTVNLDPALYRHQGELFRHFFDIVNMFKNCF